MSKVRYLYRRISAKSGTAKAPARQHPSSFFEFGGEHAFFSGKELSAPAARPAYQNPAVAKKEAPLKEEYAIQRTPVTGDFGITGKDPDSAADDSIIRFDKGQTTVAEPERGKIKREAKKHKKVELNLNGFTSEEGSATENTRVANGRVNNVSALLHLAGHEGIRHKKPDISAGEGNSNYRSRRVVEIKPTFIAPGVPSVSSIDPCTTKTVPCAASFSGIVPLSLRKVIKAIIALSAPDAATAAQLNAFFGASPAAVVLGNLGALLGEMIVLAGAHDPAADCRKDSCDDTCAKGASAYVDLNVAPAKMIFCESLLAASADERAEVFIHEALHATPGVLTQDIAYAHTRKMLTISDAEKLKNTDSYVMLIRMLDNPLAAATTPPKDTITGAVTPAETDFALRIIAFLEQWLIASKFTTGDLYSKVQEALLNPAGWQSPEGWYHHSMRDLNPLLD